MATLNGSMFFLILLLVIFEAIDSSSAQYSFHQNNKYTKRRILRTDFSLSSETKMPMYLSDGSVEFEFANKKRVECILNLKDDYRRIVGHFIKGKHAVLMDTVDHANLGDSFIQVGEMMLMEELNTPALRACSFSKCNFTAVKHEVKLYGKNAVVLIHGGGNLGNFWRFMSLFKNRITLMFLNTPVVFLPQSVFYSKDKLAQQDALVFRKHKQLAILLRDEESLNYSKTFFKWTESILSPDGAFMIGPIQTETRCKPKYEVLFLARTDLERNKLMGKIAFATRLLYSNNVSFVKLDWFGWKSQLGKRTKPVNRLDWTRFHLEVATDLLCLGQVIITDRLHAMILSTLMGLPHVYLDNRSGKIHSFRTSNFGSRPVCKDEYLRGYRARNWKEAAYFAMILRGRKEIIIP